MSKLMERAEKLENFINSQDLGYNQTSKAQLWGLTISDEYDNEFVLAHEHGDIYELLKSEAAVSAAQQYDAIGIMSLGWAAPAGNDDDDEMPPSVHPRRRRVRLLICANIKGVASVLRFSDKPDEVITDEGNAVGALAEAVQELMLKAQSTKN